MKKIFLFCIISFLFSLATETPTEMPLEPKEMLENFEYKIIFIHGTYAMNFVGMIKFIFYKLFNHNKFLQHIEIWSNKRFSKDINEHTSLCNNYVGLHKITKENISEKIYDLFYKYFVSGFKNTFKAKNIEYYMFNWNGLLLESERKNSALDLYQEIKALQNKNTKIILVGYSHGGNIALELASIAAKKKDTNFVIDLLVLLASPLNYISQINAHSYIFEMIYNFYSSYDMLQIADIFSGLPFLTLKRKLLNKKNIWNIAVKYVIKKHQKRKRSDVFIHHKRFGNILEEDIPSFLFFLVPVMHKLLKNKLHNNLLLKIDISSDDYRNMRSNKILFYKK